MSYFIKPHESSELDNLVTAIENSDYSNNPYEHFYMTNIFSQEFYSQILEALPSDKGYLHFHHPDASIDKEKSTRRRAVLNREFIGQREHFEGTGGVWEEVANVLYSQKLRDTLYAKFQKTIGRVSGTRYVQASPNVFLFRDKAGYKIRPHADSSAKAITFQIYLPEDNSHEDVGTIVNTKRGNGFDEHKRFKFHKNSGYAFPVSPTSWHSVNTLGHDNFDRNTLMVIYYLNNSKSTLWTDQRWGAGSWIP